MITKKFISRFKKTTVAVLFIFEIVSSCKVHEPAVAPASSVRYTPLQINVPSIDPDFTIAQFITPQTGYVMGARLLTTSEVILLQTHDEGQSWQMLTPDSTIHRGIASFYALDPQTCFATRSGRIKGDELVGSQDGGTSWQVINPDLPRDVSKIKFFDQQVGVAIGGSGAMRTQDGGQTWTLIKSPDYTYPSLTALQFLDNKTGFAGGGFDYDDRSIGGGAANYGSLWRTDDGGLSWQSINDSFHHIVTLFFLTAQEGFVVTNDQVLYHTTDGGHRWQQVTDRFPVVYGEMVFLSSQEGILAGETNTSSGIYHTLDGGRTWQLEYTVSSNPNLKAVNTLSWFKTEEIGYAVGRGGGLVKIELNQ